MRTLLFPLVIMAFVSCNSSPNQSANEQNTAQNSSPSETNATKTSIQSIPEKGKALVKDHFAAQMIDHVQKFDMARPSGTLYEVRLADHTEIDLDINGEWIEIDGHDDRPIPTTFLNPTILSYLSSNFPNTAVTTVERTAQGYELELSNDIDLYFDLQGNFVRQEK